MKYLVGILILVGLTIGAAALAEDGYSLGQRSSAVSTNKTNAVLGSATQDRKVFFNDTYFFGQNGFFDVGDNLRLSNVENALYETRQENSDLKEQVRALSQEVRTLNSAVKSLALTVSGGAGVTPEPNPPEQGGGLIDPPFPLPTDPVVPNTELTGQVEVLFKAACARCHTEGRESGDLVLITESGKLAKLTVEQIKSTRDRTTLTPEELAKQGLSIMPKGGQRFTVAQRNLVRAWSDAELGL